MNYADSKGKFDEEVDDKGVRILIEPSALMHIIGTKMDFVSDRIRCGHLDPVWSPAAQLGSVAGTNSLVDANILHMLQERVYLLESEFKGIMWLR